MWETKTKIQALNAKDAELVDVSSKVSDFSSVISHFLLCFAFYGDLEPVFTPQFTHGVSSLVAVQPTPKLYLCHMSVKLNLENYGIDILLKFGKNGHDLDLSLASFLVKIWDFKVLMNSLVKLGLWTVSLSGDLSAIDLNNLRIRQDAKDVQIELHLRDLFHSIPVRRTFLHQDRTISLQKQMICQYLLDFALVCHKSLGVKVVDAYLRKRKELMFTVQNNSLKLSAMKLVRSEYEEASCTMQDWEYLAGRVSSEFQKSSLRIFVGKRRVLAENEFYQRLNGTLKHLPIDFIFVRVFSEKSSLRDFLKQLCCMLLPSDSPECPNSFSEQNENLPHQVSEEKVKGGNNRMELPFDFSSNIPSHIMDRKPSETIESLLNDSRPSEKLRMDELFHANPEKTLMCSFSVSRDDFSYLQVIRQVDNKFILAFQTISHVIYVLDPHACDERIRLETLQNLLNTDLSKIVSMVMISQTDKGQSFYSINLSDMAFQSLKALGFSYGVDANATSNLTRVYQTLSIAGHILSALELQELLHEEIDTSSLNTWFSHSRVVHKILCSKACRYAIKFGDELSNEQCEELIAKLKHCSLPFQCAHGRPSIVPLSKLDY
jgi:DNA mismatch repair ATPase MutL